MPWGVVRFKPLGPWVLRAPSPLEAGVHGPGVARGMLSYPAPSTIAGALAYLGYLLRGARPSEHSNFSDVRFALKKLLGGDPRLRPGLVVAGGVLHAYLGGGGMPRLDDLLGGLSELASRAARGEFAGLGGFAGKLVSGLRSAGWKPLRTVRVGIALDRSKKSVVEGMIYSVEQLGYYHDWRPVEVLVYVSPTPPAAETPIKLGGEGGLADVILGGAEGVPDDPRNALLKGSGETWAAALITPALLEEPVDVGNASDARYGERLAESLLEGRGCAGHSRVIAIPKGEIEPGVYLAGWSAAAGRPREPRMMVPAGTVIVVEAGRGCMERLVEDGVGSHSDLGWGSLAASSSV